MLEMIAIGIVVSVIAAAIATGLHYVFAKAFARRYASAFNLKQEVVKAITNDVPHLMIKYLPQVRGLAVDMVAEGMIKANDQVMAVRKDQVISQEMSERGRAGAEARQMKKMEKEAAKAMILQQIEAKYPGASQVIPQLKGMLGFDPLEYAVQNPGAAMALLDKFLGKGGLGGGAPGGGGQDWIKP